jgi:hypothetical protein
MKLAVEEGRCGCCREGTASTECTKILDLLLETVPVLNKRLGNDAVPLQVS